MKQMAVLAMIFPQDACSTGTPHGVFGSAVVCPPIRTKMPFFPTGTYIIDPSNLGRRKVGIEILVRVGVSGSEVSSLSMPSMTMTSVSDMAVGDVGRDTYICKCRIVYSSHSRDQTSAVQTLRR